MLREKIVDLIENVTFSDLAEETVDAIIAALPGCIKPLEWRELRHPGDAVVHFACSEDYKIQAHAWGYAVSRCGLDVDHISGLDLFKAKDAAELDRKRRIMSAFGVSESKGEDDV